MSMKAVIIDEYGPTNDVLRTVDAEPPRPAAGEVLVRIRAAGVNPVDWKIRAGAGQRMGMTLPIRLGSEIAGTVEALGSGVTDLREGDAVYGIVAAGGFAEQVAVPTFRLAHKPANLDFVEAAAIPLGALTAWQAMFDLGGLAAGQRLLITNGSGGVGSLAVQIAKAHGAHVTAMASARNEGYVRGLGVDTFVDYGRQPFEQAVGDIDVVFDTVGGDTFDRAFGTLKAGGVLVTAVAFPSGEARSDGIRALRVHCKPDAVQLASVRAMVEAGTLRPHVDQVLPLAEVGRALALSEAGRTRGKIILRIGDGD